MGGEGLPVGLGTFLDGGSSFSSWSSSGDVGLLVESVCVCVCEFIHV